MRNFFQFLVSLAKNKGCRITISTLFALVAYGGWAYWVNSIHGEASALKAAVVQGTYSFIITLVLSLIIEALFRRWQYLRYGLWLIGIGVCLCLYLVSWSVNAFAMTPEILLTILPSLAISTVFTISYLLTLRKLHA